MTINNLFYNFEKIEVRGQKIFFFFSHQSLHEPSYEARQISHNGCGLAFVPCVGLWVAGHDAKPMLSEVAFHKC